MKRRISSEPWLGFEEVFGGPVSEDRLREIVGRFNWAATVELLAALSWQDRASSKDVRALLVNGLRNYNAPHPTPNRQRVLAYLDWPGALSSFEPRTNGQLLIRHRRHIPGISRLGSVP